jgi:hypothetical protein
MPVFPPPRADLLRPASGLVPALAIVLALVLAQRTPVPAWGQGLDSSARQVTLFGVIATPYDMAVDPKLAKIAPQLRKVLPNHGFKLLGVQSKRLTAGQTVTCPLEDGFSAAATLNQPADENGKVQVRCAVLLNQAVQLESLVTTPPNQLFFCEKALPNGTRLLVGIGAR